MLMEDVEKCSHGSSGDGTSGHGGADKDNNSLGSSSFNPGGHRQRKGSHALSVFEGLLRQARSRTSDTDGSEDLERADGQSFASSDTQTVRQATFHVFLHASTLPGGVKGEAPGMSTTLNEKRWLKKSLKDAVIMPTLKEFRRQHRELQTHNMDISVVVDGAAVNMTDPAVMFARSDPDEAATVDVTVLPMRNSVPFHIYVSGARFVAIATTLNKRMLDQPLKSVLVMPALDEYFKQNPNEPPVELGYVHVKVDGVEVNLEILEPASTFATRELEAGGGTDELEAIQVEITLPLVDKTVQQELEAAATAVAAATAAKSAATSLDDDILGPQMVGPVRQRRRPSLLHAFKSAAAAHEAELASIAASGQDASPVPVKRRRSFVESFEEMPSFSAIANGGQQLLALRDSAKSLARMVTATKMDPIDAALVRKVYRVLDETKQGFLGDKEIELWVHHFGGLSGSVLDACGVREHRKWQVDDFKSICQHVIGEKGADRFGQMARGLEESIQGRNAENEMYFHELALRVDRWSLWGFFGTYTFIIGTLYALREWGVFD